MSTYVCRVSIGCKEYVKVYYDVTSQYVKDARPVLTLHFCLYQYIYINMRINITEESHKRETP